MGGFHKISVCERDSDDFSWWERLKTFQLVGEIHKISVGGREVFTRFQLVGEIHKISAGGRDLPDLSCFFGALDRRREENRR